MQQVNIDNRWLQADEAVVKRMGEYYDTMKTACNKLDSIVAKAQGVRDMQKLYFRTRDKSLLPRAKILEQELDDLLAGKEKKEEIQTELFR